MSCAGDNVCWSFHPGIASGAVFSAVVREPGMLVASLQATDLNDAITGFYISWLLFFCCFCLGDAA